MKYNISKSRYCSAVQCPKILWLKKNAPDVFDASVMKQAVLDTGSAIGDLAMDLFGDYVEVPFGDLNDMIATTKNLIIAQAPVIAEASFSSDGLFCSVDLLKVLNSTEVSLLASPLAMEHWAMQYVNQCICRYPGFFPVLPQSY